MVNRKSERKLAENEMVFRNQNMKIIDGIQELKIVAKSEGQESFVEDPKQLHFLCECADENCHKRIILNPKKYEEIHKKRNRFIILPDHRVKAIEKVIKHESGYSIVEKYKNPPKRVTKLSKTDVNNT